MDFKTCGRLYGGFWQQMPKEERLGLTLDGEAVLELDYKCIHGQLLYALHGLRLDGDAYELPHLQFEREVAKRVWNIMINAKSKVSALISIREKCGLSKLNAEVLLDALERRHAGIAGSFYQCPARSLQFIDSELLLSVLTACLHEGIVCLPVHDSIIVKTSQTERAEAIMAGQLDTCLAALRRSSIEI